MGKFLQEFKQFAMRGNVVDMAVGIIIGGAFGKILAGAVFQGSAYGCLGYGLLSRKINARAYRKPA